MGRRHWLDPLARQLLRVTGDLPKTRDRPQKNGVKSSAEQVISQELESIKRKQRLAQSSPTFFVDVNRAKPSDWQKLPGCTKKMIELLMRLQRGGVQLSDSEDLFNLLELPKKQAEQWKPYLVFRWYGDSPPPIEVPLIELNCANSQTLQLMLNWPEDRLNRLLRERQRRPFEDLADLQERLCLSPSTVEKLIGIVRFSPKPAGPKLPPRS